MNRASITEEATIARVMSQLGEGRVQSADQVTLARISRARTEALRRLEGTRDVATWQVTVTRLDAEEAAARAAPTSDSALKEAEVRGYLANLASIWSRSGAEQQQQLSHALFDEIRVLGFHELSYRWSKAAESYGLDRLVPSELVLDLAELGLTSGAVGKIRSARLRPTMAWDWSPVSAPG